MDGFDDFRVSAWLREGLMMRVENAIHTIEKSILKAGAVAMVAVACSVPTISIASDAVTSLHNEVNVFHFAASDEIIEVKQMSDNLQKRLKDFDKNFEAPISDSKRDLAKRAVAAMAARTAIGSSEWASRLVIQA